MFNWEFKESIQTQASAEQIWEAWKDVDTWPQWDNSILSAELNGAFIIGTKGHMKQKSGPDVKFILTKVEPNKQFMNVSKLPFGEITFDHHYIHDEKGKAEIIHTVNISGILTPLFSVLIGAKIKANLRESMHNLSQYALHQ